MNTIPKYLMCLAAIGLALSCENICAQNSFQDDFTILSNSPSKLGDQWQVNGEEWMIAKKGWLAFPKMIPGVADSVLVCKAVTLANGYVVAADMRLNTDNGCYWGGVAYNIQDIRNFYTFRITYRKEIGSGYYQILKFKDGVPVTLRHGKVELEPKTIYTLSVEVLDEGHVKCSIKHEERMIFDSETPVEDSKGPYVGGKAGLYSTIGCAFMGFRVSPSAETVSK